MTLEKYKLDFIQRAAQCAVQARHIWPEFAACEAALESGYGTSGLSISANNIFGTKQHVHPEYGTLSLPTKEFLHGAWVVVNATWVKYPTLAQAFADRMATLQRLSAAYPHYKAALESKSGAEFVTEVSKTWSTDPHRAEKVLFIYRYAFGQYLDRAAYA